MKAWIVVVAIALAGCNALGGIPDETYKALAAAGGGCIQVESLVMGKAAVTVGGADKGVLHNGEVAVVCAGSSVTVKDAATVRAIAPPPPPK